MSEKFLKRELQHDKFLAVISTVQLVLTIVFIIILLCYSCNCCGNVDLPPDDTRPGFDVTPDDNVEYGDRETRPVEEIIEELNQKVQEGMMTISMNMNPIFENGKAEGNLLIDNDKQNRYSQVVQIYRDDTGELIYTSGAVPVGARVDFAKLDVVLEKGTYECTAHFNQIDESGNLLGKACAKITIDVLA